MAARSPQAKRYATDELLALLQETSCALGGVLTVATYDAHARGLRLADGRPWPLHQAFLKRFGSWRAALLCAGIQANPSSPIAGRFLFTEAHCVDAIRHVSRQLGRTPSASDYEAFARASHGALPSLATVRNRCGGWSPALETAGVRRDRDRRTARS